MKNSLDSKLQVDFYVLLELNLESEILPKREALEP